MKTTKLQYLIDRLGLTQNQLAKLTDLENYQICNLAKGVKDDCYLSTAKKICKALSAVAKKKISLDMVFGDGNPETLFKPEPSQNAKGTSSKVETTPISNTNA